MTPRRSAACPERALITAATSGLGLEAAHQLAESGYDLVLVARNEVRLLDTAESIANQFQVPMDSISADLSDCYQLERVACSVVRGALAGAKRGRAVVNPSFRYKLITTSRGSGRVHRAPFAETAG